jgi:hypothetical protein
MLVNGNSKPYFLNFFQQIISAKTLSDAWNLFNDLSIKSEENLNEYK